MDRKGFNPADLICDIALGKVRGKNIDVRFKAACEFSKYVAPQLVRTELVGLNGGPIQQGPMQIVIDYGDAVPDTAVSSETPEAPSGTSAGSQGSQAL
jgi:hypothetical protein